ncbi:hypothetical protein CC85DRAFT_167713 [Cutaneotrichosporon oleaginosum]|uniref:Uncharacterized protein n=1 Tax=Cutaneotrichosporon oleaginosum TaxID=879819 RepID=A0A0J0XFU6_9TREE|nr:uncharacterized protein CC85DRAFT_167713 [Cutaneotrichosporon oleaginosum]KLT39936.1 hypothetical protein CC85DRAFT_167713 [Cutaneotrichosporon oleaginosum]TXT08350.1 hypothetical protein COLE_05274 [Cutaneotrichosporon oleaginosum]
MQQLCTNKPAPLLAVQSYSPPNGLPLFNSSSSPSSPTQTSLITSHAACFTRHRERTAASPSSHHPIPPTATSHTLRKDCASSMRCAWAAHQGSTKTRSLLKSRSSARPALSSGVQVRSRSKRPCSRTELLISRLT